MKSNRATTVLLFLFFASLSTLWGLEMAGVLTRAEREQRAERILPDVAGSADPLSVRKIVIDRGPEHLVFERSGPALDRWQMTDPLNVAADATRLEALARNLRELRKSQDSGTLEGDPASFGLTPPAMTVHVYGPRGSSGSTDLQELASLELGKVVRGSRYVRASQASGIEVVDPKPLEFLDRPVADWRQAVVMGVPSFQVTAVTVHRDGKTIAAERTAAGRWRLTQPVLAPANSAKVESLLAALASLRVTDVPKGFVANDVKDFEPFGLANPEATVEVRTREGTDPIVLHVGKAVKDHPEWAYVRQGDQDDVVAVNAKALSEIPSDAVTLRSKVVSDFEPALVNRIEVSTPDKTFLIEKTARNWQLLTPEASPADQVTIKSFLDHLDKLEASEFLDPKVVRDPRLDSPYYKIKLWEGPHVPAQTASSGGPGSEPPVGKPALSLEIGRHDVLRKTIYARLATDSVILAIPSTLLEILPRNEYAFRDKSIVTEDPSRIQKLIIRRGDRVDELSPLVNGQPNRWRMVKPVDALADTPTITRALAALTSLRAEEFAAGASANRAIFGLDAPRMEITWESDKRRSLRIGSTVPKTSSVYATIEGEPYVFTLGAETIGLFTADFHDHRVMSFPPDRAQRITLAWHGRTLELHRRNAVERGQLAWVADDGADIQGLDLSRMNALVAVLANLQTLAFYQYEGNFPEIAELSHPRLKVSVSFGEGTPPQVIRIGARTPDGQVFAALGTATTGPVFFLPAASWDELIRSGERYAPIPDNPFAPNP
jgi:hypothetical protein